MQQTFDFADVLTARGYVAPLIL